MTQTGMIEISFNPKLTKFSDDIDLKTLTYEDEAQPGVKKPVIEIFVEPTVEQDEEDVKMTWEYTEFTQTKMVIQAYFEEPLSISFDDPNFISIKFSDPDLWISEVGIQMEPDDRLLSRPLMRQLP